MNIKYVIKRLFFSFITLILAMGVNFFIVQMTPGGPLESLLFKLQSGSLVQGEILEDFDPLSMSLDTQSSTNAESILGTVTFSMLPKKVRQQMIENFNFDKSFFERLGLFYKKLFTFDFGYSFYYQLPVKSILLERVLPTFILSSISILAIYCFAMLLGILKAFYADTLFDRISHFFLVIGHSIPTYMIGLMFLIFFAGGTLWSFFPLKGLYSSHWSDFSLWEKVKDLIWHLSLPVTTLVLGGSATLVFIVKSAILREYDQPYTSAARIRGRSANGVLWKEVMPNVLVPIFASFPSLLMHLILSTNVLTEIVFSINGIGLLMYESILNYDFPVIFACLFFYTALSILLHFIMDCIYVTVDKRIDYA